MNNTDFKIFILGLLFVNFISFKPVSSRNYDISRRERSSFSGLITSDVIEGSVISWASKRNSNVHMGECCLGDITFTVARKQSGGIYFYNNLICRLLDEFFVKSGVYTYNHMPISLNESGDGRSFYYIVASGSEGFPWRLKIGPGDWDIQIYELDELSSCALAFKVAGVDIDTNKDVATVDVSGSMTTSQNFVLDTNVGFPTIAERRI